MGPRQLTLFDVMDNRCFSKIVNEKKHDTSAIRLSREWIDRLSKYTLSDYIMDIESIGLEKIWDYICQFVLDNTAQHPDLLQTDNWGELYEIGLAIRDKIEKKKSGQYYTPDDVAQVMCEWFDKCEGSAVCDVACGTGKLILTYLDYIGKDKARDLISSGNLYLYDSDSVALKICRSTIAIQYGMDIEDKINVVWGDFLDWTIDLPDNCKVISNPPYAGIKKMQDCWNHTDVVLKTKEYYSAFMEKIIKQAISSVIITPFSFISGSKFYPLRKAMCTIGNGFIVAFDNVPGNIFCGRKHGIFNTNTANSVRAAITVVHRSANIFGFRVSPLIRFKNSERNRLLQCGVLEKTLSDTYQIVDKENPAFQKIGKTLAPLFDAWVSQSRFTVKDLLSDEKTGYMLDIPNTCRYYTTACKRKLNRSGSITVFVPDEDQYYFLYCMINSSFAYWWWRIYDGGITYPLGLLKRMPVPFNLLSNEDKSFFADTAKELMEKENRYIVIKKNAGVLQENIKFPVEYRERINKRLLLILGADAAQDPFLRIHSNRSFTV